LVDSNILLSII